MTARTLGILIGSALVLVAACQPAAPLSTTPAAATSPAATTSPSAGPTLTSSAGSTASATPTPGTTSSAGEADVEIGPGTFFLADPRAGLDGLTSYTQTLTVAFDGTVDGAPRSWTTTYRLQRTAGPSTSVLTTETRDEQGSTHAFWAEAAGTAYESSDDGACTGQQLDPENSVVASAEPALRLPALLGAEEAGTESVDNVLAHHYTFDARALIELGVDTNGDVWIAADADYVVRFQRTTTADAAYFGGGLGGTMTWDYALTDINSLSDLAVPAGCQLEVPIMAEATNTLVLPRYAGFDTASSVPDVVAFYKQQMPSFGWAVTSEPFEGSDTAVIEFSRNDEVLNLIVTTTELGTRVDLALSGG